MGEAEGVEVCPDEETGVIPLNQTYLYNIYIYKYNICNMLQVL